MKKQIHGGNIYKLLQENRVSAGNYIDFSANINPNGPPEWLRSHINRDLDMIQHYPDPDCRELRRVIAKRYQVAEESILAGNGTTELLHLLPRILEQKQVIIPVPSYIDYVSVFQKNGFSIKAVALSEENDFSITPEIVAANLRGNDVAVFGNPANPAGSFMPDDDIVQLAQAYPETLFVIDEAFHDFTSHFSTVGNGADNIITLNSLTKFFAIPGLRVGFGIFPSHYASRMKALIPQWSVNTFAQSTAVRALQDDEYCRYSRKNVQTLKDVLVSELQKIPCLRIFASSANYLLLKLGDGLSAGTLYKELLRDDIIIRRCENYMGLDKTYFRVAVRSESENRLLVQSLRRILKVEKQAARKSVKPASTLMFQGTSSNAGKSIMSAAFCRILLQDGFKVAPFKAQNMSLNSHVTRDGGEMGRAQVVQAVAAKVDPDCLMNPILLKPNSDTGSQVIVNGKPVANMDIRQYHSFKGQAWDSVVKSYELLSEHYDVIVLEGAGSPGEINLKRHDIVNMKMARYAGAPVLLVGDIDRGGVYASFAGTMDVLEEWERNLIAGFVVNKFRGDQTLLDDAHTFIRNHTGRDVLAVVPYISDLSIPQEDSVSLREGFYGNNKTESDQVEIVVVDLPHISNFTDIDPLYHEPDVNVRFVKNSCDIGDPAAIILPGSKNVAGDLAHLKDRGFYQTLPVYAEKGCVIVGICGGYQMLGRAMRDPHQIETTSDTISGIGLIEVDTMLHPDKTLRRREGTHIQSGLKISGYEIHHGITEGGLEAVLRFDDGGTCGSRSVNAAVWGAYLHGIFDEDLFRRWFIDELRVLKNLPVKGDVLMPYNLEKSLDELADQVRSCFNMDNIYRIMNI